MSVHQMISPEVIEHAKAEAELLLNPERVAYDGKTDVEDFEARLTRCYELSGHAVVFGTAPKGSVLVHGTIHRDDSPLGRIGHGWVVLPDGRVWEPISGNAYHDGMFRYLFNPIEEATYTKAQARKMMNATGEYGRWHESEYR